MVDIIIVIISSLVLFLGWLVQRKTEQIKIMENQLSERKYKAYSEVVDIFYGILKDTKNNKRSNQKNLMESLFNSKRDIFLYASDEVFRKFNVWLSFSAKNESLEEGANLKQMRFFIDFILEIRKDMQGKKTKITEREILINLIQDEKEVDNFLSE